VISFIECKFRL